MRWMICAAALAVAASCSLLESEPEPAPVEAATADEEKCYTVDLFGDHRIRKPGRDVPEKYRAFSGKWGSGAWNDRWCHDLYILSVSETGAVRMIETYAPQPQWGRRAAAYRRDAQIDKRGVLRVSYGVIEMEYRVEGDQLYGIRREGTSEPMDITLQRGRVYSPIAARLRR